ncbi:MAG: 3-phosphoshikimate 1-carboxyvinyltransferase [Sphingobacteriia bacterium]|nr:MAG: 3-phosphoshikimate 1-carboxyvinyltransferase [Sphingobacteriia bacterium]TAG30957.1 MAG: 3-phosphoshikimate 1-carboxyvinyltransferase [Sphingobacteriia bacterium]
MIVTVYPSTIQGIIQANAGKSSMQRACAAALLRTGNTIICNPGNSHDDLAAINVIQKLGAVISYTAEGSLQIISKGVQPQSPELNCGESGLGIRMFTPLAALSNQPLLINGTGSLLKRPMHFFDEVFPQLGVKVNSNNGQLPLTIQGPLVPADITIDGSLSSQFLTGLLMAFGAAGAEGITITVTNLKSKPYIDLTLNVMKHFGWIVEHDSYTKFSFTKAISSTQNPLYYEVEGDWSGAAFLLVAGALAGGITVKGLDIQSTQADKAILQALIDAGARLSIQDKNIEIAPLPLKAFHFNATDCPDLFPPLVALAAYCEGTTVIEGVNRLAHKESDRGLTLQDEFAKLGVEIILQGNLMLVKGSAELGKTGHVKVHSRHDHRIAMACAIAALKCNNSVEIEAAEAINKSYPDFYSHIMALGVRVEMK